MPATKEEIIIIMIMIIIAIIIIQGVTGGVYVMVSRPDGRLQPWLAACLVMVSQ